MEQTSVRYILIRTAFFTQEALVIFITDGAQTKSSHTWAGNSCKPIPLIKGVLENVNQERGQCHPWKKFKPLIGRPYIFEKLLGKLLNSPDAFFQVNPLQTEHLYKTALQFADLTNQETVVDAYCGVGTLALLAAPLAKRSIGIECVAEPLKMQRVNATLNSTPNCTFYLGHAEKTA